ncbi:MAG TPA: M23 family metallopeptidase [Longimicrobium sp.]|nr:M23 family metallopeptidase [Longimicrobium sp.]
MALPALGDVAGAQETQPVVRSNVSVIRIRDGEVSRTSLWTLSPQARPDVYRAQLANGKPHRVTFITDVDSISFLVEEGKQYDFVVQKGDTANYTRIVGARLVPAPGIVAGQVTVAANPARVCLDPRPTPYLNFDLIVRNGTEGEIRVAELRALVLNAAGQVVERRVVGQQALELLGPGRVVGPLSDALIFNPFTFGTVREGSRLRYELLLAGAGAPAASVMVEPRPCLPRTRLVSPLAGRVAVFDGYDFLSHHRRTDYLGGLRTLGATDNPSRFAMDLMVVDSAGRAFRGDSTRNEAWLGWGRPVRAAGDGIVAATHDGQPDNDTVGVENRWTQRSVAREPMTTFGNYVLIDHGNGEFSLTAHLQAGSLRVRQGDHVKAGDVVARVGNSGSSRGPHVHYELRSGWGFVVTTMPPYFRDVRVTGTGEGRGGAPVPVNTGDFFVAR